MTRPIRLCKECGNPMGPADRFSTCTDCVSSIVFSARRVTDEAAEDATVPLQCSECASHLTEATRSLIKPSRCSDCGGDLTEFERWHHWNLEFADFQDAIRSSRSYRVHRVVPTPPDPEWGEVYGLSIDEAIGWSIGGYFFPGAHLPWEELGFACDEAFALVSAGMTLDDAEALRASGITSEILVEALETGNVGKLSRLDIGEMRAAGVPLSADGIARWGGLTASQIFDAVDREFIDGDSYWPYRDHELSAEEVEEFRRSGFHSPREIIAEYLARRAGVPSEDLAAWQATGLGLDEIRAWVEIGGLRTPEAARRWSSAGWSAPEASSWIEAGFAPTIARRWYATGVDAPTALRRSAAGLKPPSTR